MLAAEQALATKGATEATQAVIDASRPAKAKVGGGEADTYTIPDVEDSIASIEERGSYPGMQGEGDDHTGYLAVAEKLQPPLLDPKNHELRVLVEHRTDDVRAAVNDILKGKKSAVWDKFVAAVTAMDKAR